MLPKRNKQQLMRVFKSKNTLMSDYFLKEKDADFSKKYQNKTQTDQSYVQQGKLQG